MKNVSQSELGRLFQSLSELLSKAYIARGLVTTATVGSRPEEELGDSVCELASLVADSVDDVVDRLDRFNEILHDVENL
jgi:hypothetical protein